MKDNCFTEFCCFLPNRNIHRYTHEDLNKVAYVCFCFLSFFHFASTELYIILRWLHPSVFKMIMDALKVNLPATNCAKPWINSFFVASCRLFIFHIEVNILSIQITEGLQGYPVHLYFFSLQDSLPFLECHYLLLFLDFVGISTPPNFKIVAKYT